MKCERCHKETNSYKMSWFNTQMICKNCSEDEQTHPAFKAAKEEVLRRESLGDMNFQGVGLPEDLKYI